MTHEDERLICQNCRQPFRMGEPIDTDPLNAERWGETYHRHLRIEQCIKRLALAIADKVPA